MARVITFGEIMMRLQPFGYKRFLQADSFEVVYGGGEANVACFLSQMNIDAGFLSKLPNNELGQSAINALRALGVDTSCVARGGDRMGLYFCEKGASQRPSKVIYDRAGASINSIKKADFDFDTVFDGVEWFHFTGITPALSDTVADFCKIVLEECKSRSITVSCDLNYRAKLWTREKAKVVMSDLMQYVDVLISNEEDCKDVFGIVADNSSIDGGVLSVDGYKAVAEQVMQKFDIKTMAFTLRESISASINNWSAILVQDGQVYKSKKYNLQIVDRVGGGDSFGGGLIFSILSGKSPQECIEFAVAGSALKHSIEGDTAILTEAEIEKLAKGNGSGRVQR